MNIHTLLETFRTFKILVVGDVMVDVYLWGSVNRISPEAPVPVVMQSHTENRLGGASNVALNIHSLGATPIICTVIGEDEAGILFKTMTIKQRMTSMGIIKAPIRKTTVKTRVIAGHQQLLRIDDEIDAYLNADLTDMIWTRINEIITNQGIQAIVFQDYDKGVLTRELIEKTIQLAAKKKIPTLVDPKSRNFKHYRGATLFKPNFKELTEGLNLHISKNDFKAIHNAAKQLIKDAGFSMVMTTLSEHGILITDGKTFHVVPTDVRDVADVSGAGDTVIAMASLCLAAGTDALTLARLSNLAAGLVCEKVGVVPVKREWLLNADISFKK
ncbi:MAG: D-glycero-beta-D-manno-heptose-7-phosphate kinase [Bacteroidales bacterium]|nr:D-glycero-beta-D-manno-heptose-7-phosphate kinase [Bacteroidales bacterium]